MCGFGALSRAHLQRVADANRQAQFSSSRVRACMASSPSCIPRRPPSMRDVHASWARRGRIGGRPHPAPSRGYGAVLGSIELAATVHGASQRGEATRRADRHSAGVRRIGHAPAARRPLGQVTTRVRRLQRENDRPLEFILAGRSALRRVRGAAAADGAAGRLGHGRDRRRGGGHGRSRASSA